MMRALTVVTLLLCLLAALPAAAQTPTSPPETQQAPILIAPEVFDRGAAALQAQNVEQAALDMSLFILMNPTFSQAYYVRALAYTSLENTDLALADIEQALSTAPDLPEYEAAVYALRANIHTTAQNYAAAIDDYTAAIAINPIPDLYANRALLYLATDDTGNALDDFTEALAGAPDDPVLRLYHGYTNARLGNEDAAAEDYYAYLQLIETRRVNGPRLTSGQAQTLTLSEGVVQAFEIQGERGQLLTVAAQPRPADQVDPLLILLDDDGNVLAANDDTGPTGSAAIVDFPLPATGTYTLLLTHSLGGAEGQVALVYEISK